MEHKAEIYYYDIGDYLSREEKLKIIDEFGSMEKLPFTRLTPNEHGDWISVRNEKFSTWIAIGDKDDKTNSKTFFVPLYSRGLSTARDAWCYSFSKNSLTKHMNETINFYNEQRVLYHNLKKTNDKISVNEAVSYNDAKLSWNRSTFQRCEKNQEISFIESAQRVSMYRPFCIQNSYFHATMNDMTYQLEKLFPSSEKKNVLICIPGIGDKKTHSCIITNKVPDLGLMSATQCFPLYWYETIEPDQKSLFADNDTQIVRHEAVSDFILERAQSKYGNKVQREDIFYYVYGILHSKSYRETFEADLKKMLPRIPLVSDYQKFWDFSKAGRELANLHLNYEKVAAYPDVQVESRKMVHYEFSKTIYDYDDGTPMAAEAAKKHASSKADEYEYYAVQQMKFPKKGQKDTIIYNHYHTIKHIPEKAYEYVVNGKSAIEWIMERYAITTDKKSGITNNPNDWALEHEQARYIFDLLLSVINVSVQTVDIVNNLPEVDWEKE